MPDRVERTSTFRSEVGAMSRLALPVVLAELGWMMMGIVDTLMVGALGAVEIGAVGLASTLYLAVAILGMGLLLGLDTLVSQAFGARRLDECNVWLLHGTALALLLTPPVMLLTWIVTPGLAFVGVNAAVLAVTVPYMDVLNWSTAPLLLYTALRRYLQSFGVVVPMMFALITANLVNVVANWALIFGHLGAPALGTRGSAWATVIARIYMAGVLLVAIVRQERRQPTALWHTRLFIERIRMRRLLQLGAPAAGQLCLEIAVFAAATALAGRLAATALAAHQIALNIASLTFMVPLGVASAGAVRVGHAVGSLDAVGAERSGWTALLLGAGFMACAALVLLVAPSRIIRLFTGDAAVLEIGVSLLFVAAVFQLFDGLQVVATGILRGVGDTRTPMICNLAGHWAIGLPFGYMLCFRWGYGVIGLWMGLSLGLILVGTVLLGVWRRRIRQLREDRPVVISIPA